MSKAFACALSICLHILTHKDMSQDQKDTLDQWFFRQWSRIFTDVHALAFTCEPLYRAFSGYFNDTYVNQILSMRSDVESSCQKDLPDICDNENHYGQLLGKFLNLCDAPNWLIHSIREWQPKLICGKFKLHKNPFQIQVQCARCDSLKSRRQT